MSPVLQTDILRMPACRTSGCLSLSAEQNLHYNRITKANKSIFINFVLISSIYFLHNYNISNICEIKVLVLKAQGVSTKTCFRILSTLSNI